MNDKKLPNKKTLTANDVARALGVSFGFAIKQPIPHVELKSGQRIHRRYQREDVQKYIEDHRKAFGAEGVATA